MMAVIGIEERALAEICKQNDTVIANYNCLGQLVISSAGENIARAAESAKAGGAARTIPLTGERRFPLSLDATGR
jgi:[acyl-carrier-protein] S-malonyltransferase